MKQKFSRSILVTLIFILTASLVGCDSSSKIVGKWEMVEHDTYALEFLEDGTVLFYELNSVGKTGTYKFVDNKTISIDWSDTTPFLSTVSLAGSRMTLTRDGNDVVYKRVN